MACPHRGELLPRVRGCASTQRFTLATALSRTPQNLVIFVLLLCCCNIVFAVRGCASTHMCDQRFALATALRHKGSARAVATLCLQTWSYFGLLI